MEVELVFTANKNIYGTILVSSLPFEDIAVNRYEDVTRELQAEPHLIDISRQESLKLTLPYVNMQKYWTIGALTPPRQWKVRVRVLALGTLTTEAPASVSLEVWANFVNPELSKFSDAVFQSRVLDRHANPLVRGASYLNRLGELIPAAASALAGNAPAATVASAAAAATATSFSVGAGLAASRAAVGIAKDVSSLTSKPANVKPQVCPDLSGLSSTTVSFLGTGVRGSKRDLPSIRNADDIYQICSTPAYYGTFTLASTTDTFDIPVQPNLTGSYMAYFLRMFRYYRCDTEVMIRFAAAPDVTAKIAVQLAPDGIPSSGTGDTPFWEISAKGTQDFSLVVPFLEQKHYLESYEVLSPTLRVRLLRNLQGLYDVAPTIRASVFLRPINLSFGGQQSPCAGTLHMTFADAFSSPYKIGNSYESNFMTQDGSLMGLLSRYSSRDSEGLPVFPFPSRLSAELYKYDSFDFLAQLFQFYTGSMDVKYLLDGPPPEGTVQLAVGNGNTPGPNGSTFKAGNSMILTSQASYPVLELNFPYERTWEFDCLDEPLATYVPEINAWGSVSQVYLRPGPDFAFFTLLPTPGFADNFNAVFQSTVQRMVGVTNYMGIDSITNSVTTSTIISPPFVDMAFNVEIEVQVSRTAGTADFNGAIGLTLNPALTTVNQIMQNSLCSAMVKWVDVTNSGKYVAKAKTRMCLSGYSGPFYISRVVDASVSAEFLWIIRCFPFSSMHVPVTPDSAYCSAIPYLPTTSYAVPVPVEGTFTPSSTLDVNVVNPVFTTVPSNTSATWVCNFKPS